MNYLILTRKQPGKVLTRHPPITACLWPGPRGGEAAREPAL